MAAGAPDSPQGVKFQGLCRSKSLRLQRPEGRLQLVRSVLGVEGIGQPERTPGAAPFPHMGVAEDRSLELLPRVCCWVRDRVRLRVRVRSGPVSVKREEGLYACSLWPVHHRSAEEVLWCTLQVPEVQHRAAGWSLPGPLPGGNQALSG